MDRQSELEVEIKSLEAQVRRFQKVEDLIGRVCDSLDIYEDKELLESCAPYPLAVKVATLKEKQEWNEERVTKLEKMVKEIQKDHVKPWEG